MNYMEATRKIVNAFYSNREGSEDYIVRVEYEPNPLNYDGIDSVSAFVVRQDRVSRDFNAPKAETVILKSSRCEIIEAALNHLAHAAGVSV